MGQFRKNRKSFVSVLAFSERTMFYFFIFFAVLLMVVSVMQPQLTSKLKISTIDIVSPVLSFINRPFEEASEGINSISSVAALKAENSRLQAENERLKEWYQTALMLEAENKSLQSLLNLKLDPQRQYISARTLSDTQNTFSKTLLIAAGQKQNIEKDQVVLSGEGLLGRVIEVGEKVSRILLITDINSRIPVKIENSNKRAILSGNNGFYLSMEHGDFAGPEIIGQKVITTGDGGVFPLGLTVGKIHKIEDGKFLVQPFSKMDNIEFVRILISAEGENPVTLGTL